ncbi:Hsp70 family protein, partial [candidate division WWE3 bacterium]|nr:Hsp70 family protein [candidate division WWE3 bacterium]
NPDEVVAIGAAIQAGVLGGEVKDILLLDVTPLTLGIETLGGVSTPLIERNTTIPASKSQIFSTAADSQTSVEVHVLQGERPMANDNKSLGKFILSGIPPAPRGVPQVEVTFDIDANGILNVSAKDKATGVEQKITITDSTGLSDDEVEKMRQEADANKDEDEKRKKVIELRNRADTLIYSAEKAIKESKDKVDSAIIEQVEEKVKALREVLNEDEPDPIEAKINDLSETIQQIGSELYKNVQEDQANAENATGSGDAAEGEVVEEEQSNESEDSEA